MNPCCDLDNSKPTFLHDTLAHDDASQYQVWKQMFSSLADSNVSQDLQLKLGDGGGWGGGERKRCRLVDGGRGPVFSLAVLLDLWHYRFITIVNAFACNLSLSLSLLYLLFVCLMYASVLE